MSVSAPQSVHPVIRAARHREMTLPSCTHCFGNNVRKLHIRRKEEWNRRRVWRLSLRGVVVELDEIEIQSTPTLLLCVRDERRRRREKRQPWRKRQCLLRS